jgi:hypothetical protein
VNVTDCYANDELQNCAMLEQTQRNVRAQRPRSGGEHNSGAVK